MSVDKFSGYLPDDITEEEYPTQLMEYVRISVRHLVEFILQHGDLDNRSGKLPDATAMQEGTRIHRKIQKSAGGDYRPEVTLKEQVTYCDAIISVEGRADGIFSAKRGDLLEQVENTTPAFKSTSTTDDDVEEEDAADHQLSLTEISEVIVNDSDDTSPNVPSEHVASDTSSELSNENVSALYQLDPEETLTVIDEIKGIETDVDKLEAPRRLHLAQARCYAAIYAQEMELDRIGVRITYVNLDFEDVRYFYQEYDTEENRLWFKNLIDEFHKWIAWQVAHRLELAESMKDLQFPFTYRTGQRHLVASVYQAIKDQQQLFVEAPTGVGKTMSMIYPSIRAMGEDKARRLFYLTAKNVTRQVANEAFHILESKGLRLKHVTITAKDKICPMLETDCNPDYCPYAKGHFDRINDAVFSLLNEADCYDAETILKKANEANVCPFELSLDVSSWADAIVGDYNYAFDPRAHLKRFFGDGISSQGILLIDEAHNLVDRGREMYSAVLSKKAILATKKAFKDKSRRVIRDLDKINRHLLQIRHLVEEQDKPYYRYTHTDGLDVEVTRLVTDMQHFFENDTTGTFQNVSEAYFAFRDFVDACDRMTDNYLLYAAIDEEENDLLFHIRCIDPSEDLQKQADKAVSTMYFSATLLPMDYFRSLLSNREQDYAVYAETPFSQEQRCILIGKGVGTRYKDRGFAMYNRIVDYIYETAAAQKGHYMAFFPSYKMMEDVFKVYREKYGHKDINWVIQGKYMGDEDRTIFLENFYEDPEDTLIGFCVMGGLFSEGIDLTGSKLIGAIVVGCGLPQVSPEKEMEMQFYKERNQDGFGYAYRIPGMNKVLQAAGRVIRSSTDHGVIVLLDDRFTESSYRRLFPREWSDCRTVTLEEIPAVLSDFWTGIS